MTTSNHDLADLAAMYAAGTLAPAEHEAFEERLLAGDTDFAEAFAAVRDVADRFLRSDPAVEPRPITRSNLINAIAPSKPAADFTVVDAEADAAAEDPAAMVVVRANDVGWNETTIPGVQSRNLFVDRANLRVTVLLKLAAGVQFPDHEHPGVEECMVIEGDLDLAGTTLRSGDYIRIPKNGQHGTPRTRSGCVLLVISPLTDAA